MDNVLEVRGLRKKYTRFELQDVSFAIPEGCIAGFVGNNGAGKTTTIRAILNLIHRDAVFDIVIFMFHPFSVYLYTSHYTLTYHSCQ